MIFDKIPVLLADDDKDDRMLFSEALDEIELDTDLTMVTDGEQLMQHLFTFNIDLPALIFLDLNMPRKNGYECLSEIKADPKLKELPVVIYSTSFDPVIVNKLYNNGAQYYIRKPSEFSRLKEVILDAINLTGENNFQPAREHFVLQS